MYVQQEDDTTKINIHSSHNMLIWPIIWPILFGIRGVLNDQPLNKPIN